MKKMMFTLVAMLTIAVSANAMSYEQARNEALFLTDKMAYELNLSDAQYEAAYEINLDYLMSVTHSSNVFGTYWERRNLDMSYILYQWQWDAFRTALYFYRPLYWDAGFWHFRIYSYYPHRDYFYFGRPHFFATYRGGHSWRHNGGRSYYEGRHHVFRPDHPRDQHVGMRNGWDRGDYRNNYSRSSTRYTERSGNNDHSDYRYDNNNRSNNRYDGTNRNSTTPSSTYNGSRSTLGSQVGSSRGGSTMGSSRGGATMSSSSRGGATMSSSSRGGASMSRGSSSSGRSGGNASSGNSSRSGGGRR